MFMYEGGMIVDYVTSANYPPEVDRQVREHMLAWARTLPGQSRVRLGKIGTMQGSDVNLKRMEHE